MKHKLISLFILMTVCFTSAYSQTRPDKKFDKRLLFLTSQPAIEVSYGLSDIAVNGNSYGLANAGLFELKLGFSSSRSTDYGKNILRYRNNFVFISNAASKNYLKSENSGINNDLWKFGFGDREGFGVKLGAMSIMPYTSNSFSWSKFSYGNPDPMNPSVLDDFNDVFRFGSTTEAGINFQITKGFSLQPKYETADIFPRHLFGKQALSSLIEHGGLFLLDRFTKAIMKSSPVAGTFVKFILKNAYEYGFYQLRKNQMNWPFTSVAPLRYSSFKMGVTFTF